MATRASAVVGPGPGAAAPSPRLLIVGGAALVALVLAVVGVALLLNKGDGAQAVSEKGGGKDPGTGALAASPTSPAEGKAVSERGGGKDTIQKGGGRAPGSPGAKARKDGGGRTVKANAGPAWAPAAHAAEYPFPVPPLEIYARLGKVGARKAEPIPAADADLLAACWRARREKPAKRLPQADDAAGTLHLIAAGVPGKERARYLKKFTELVAAADEAVAGGRTDSEKADRLLRFLHKGVMAKGYVEWQTTLRAVLDTGQFNCVSASTVYFLVGTRLGLRLQPVLVSGESFSAGHAAVDLIDGKARVQVEPTNPEGHDWPAKLKRPGVIVIGLQPNRAKAYDADGLGLASAAASNLGTAASKAGPPRPAEAVRWCAIALTLDPADPTAARNMTAVISNWGLRKKEARNYEDALALYAFARSALGNQGSLEHNYRVVWEHYLDEVFGAGKFAEGLKLLPRAAAAFPKEMKFAVPADWVARAAGRKSRKDGWESGLAFADEALKHLAGEAARGVRSWKAAARRQWSQQLLDGGDVDSSLKVLAAGLQEAPGDQQLVDGLAYHTQQALAALDRKGGPKAALAHFKEVSEKFPKAPGIRDAGFRHAARVADALAAARKFADALKAADTYAPLAGDRAREVRGGVYDKWGRSLAAAGRWEDALAKFAKGRKESPHDWRLSNNAIATVDQWAAAAIKTKDWKEAIRRYDVGLKYFPASDHLKRNREYCKGQFKE